MAFERYGGLVWTGEQKPPEHDWRMQAASLGVAAGVGAIGFKALMITNPTDGTRLIDKAIVGARTYGNLMPFQLGNTFRIPEIFSVFAGAKYQGLTPTGTGKFGTSWDVSFLRDEAGGTTRSTYNYLKSLLGQDDAWLSQRGITPNMVAGAQNAASQLVFERDANAVRGSLYSVVGGERHLLSSNVALAQFTGEAADLTAVLDKTSPINRYVYGLAQSMNLFGPGFNEETLFTRKKENVPLGEGIRPKFIPVSGDPVLQARTVFGSMPMERYNRLLGGVVEQIGGKGATQFLERIGLRHAGGVLSGPGSHMWLRFGAGAAGVAAVGALAVGETDWLKRRFGPAVDASVSAGIAGTLGWLTRKAGFSKKAGLAVAGGSFLAQMVLPGFNDGLMPGAATMWAKANVIRGMPLNPFNYYRRTLEGFLPGISSVNTSIMLGATAVGLSYLENPFTGRTLAHDIYHQIPEAFGIKPSNLGTIRPVHKVRQQFWYNLYSSAPDTVKQTTEYQLINASIAREGPYLSWGQREQLRGAYKKNAGMSWHEWNVHRNEQWARAEDQVRQALSMNDPLTPLNSSLVETMRDIGGRHLRADMPWWKKVSMHAEGLAAQWKHAFLGADLADERVVAGIAGAGFKAPLGRLGLIFAGTALAHSIVTGGLFGSMESSQELRDIYSGKQLVSVGKSRWWEGGGTPYEGSKTSYYRPHWYALMKNRVREAGIWGEDEDRYSPVAKWLLNNFTYKLEEQNYYDRPYPISSAAFANVPIIGGLLSGSIGRLIKPAKLMHVSEWMREGPEGGLEYADVFEGWRYEPAYGLGAPGHGIPSSPYAARHLLSFANYQFRDLEGMTGWAKNVLSDLIVGTDTYFTDQTQLADAGLMTSNRLRFWELSMGGGFFMNEFVRRMLPSDRKEIEKLNPIMNTMPTWLPDRYKYGDPYRSIEWGEARLPGPGYARIHPELKGIDPEDYPLIYQYDILANVAPFSVEYRQTRDRLYRARAAGGTTTDMDAWIDRIDSMARDRWNIYDMNPVDKNAIQLPGSSIVRAAYSTGLGMMRDAVAPAEYMVPMGFRPMQKLMAGNRSPIERYEYERMYGTPMAFWDHPIRDWFRPAAYSAAHFMGLGYRGKPWWRSEADQNAAYFDQLEFMKWMQIAQEAQDAGDIRKKIQAEYMAGSTRYGVNPEGNPMSIYWSLPSEDRAFFNSFAYAEGGDRSRILEMVPEDQQQLYEALWRRMDQGDPDLFAGTHTGPDSRYLYSRFAGIQNAPAPAEDWIGWHEDVDLQDIRVRYVNEMGRDLHDFGLWESQLRSSMAQPYLEGSTAYIDEVGGPGMRGQIVSQMRQMTANPFARPDYQLYDNGFLTSSVALTYDDHRDGDIYSAMQGYLNGN